MSSGKVRVAEAFFCGLITACSVRLTGKKTLKRFRFVLTYRCTFTDGVKIFQSICENISFCVVFLMLVLFCRQNVNLRDYSL